MGVTAGGDEEGEMHQSVPWVVREERPSKTHKRDLRHQERKCARRRNYRSPLLQPGLNCVLLRASIKARARWRRAAWGDSVECAIGIIAGIATIIAVTAGIIPLVQRADDPDNGEGPCDNECKPEEKIATNVRAWVYGAGS